MYDQAPLPPTPLMRWVPGEICVLASLPVGAAERGLGDALAPLPERLGAYIAGRVAAADADARAGGALSGPLASALRPAALRGYAPVLRPAGEPSAARVRLQSTDDEAWVLRYHDPRLADAARLRELILLLNDDARAADGIALRGPDAAGDAPAMTVKAVMPNWLLASAPKTHTGAGPGSQPMPAPAPNPGAAQFPKVDAFLAHFAAGPTVPAEVVVAILDTCPAEADVQAAAATRFPAHALLADVAANVRIGRPPSLAPGAFAHLDPDQVDASAVTVNWRDAFDADNAAYAMPDHGLFVAGMVRSIAPGAEVHLIRALSDNGVGDMFALIQLLTQLPDALGIGDGRRLVVNLSLVADIPSPAEMQEEWLPDTVGQPLTEAEAAQLQAIWRGAHAALHQAIQWLNTQKGVLVVAAAGNDALGVGARPAPRVPAAYDEVLSVAATALGDRPASYSNGGDVPGSTPNGVATFGGNARAGIVGQPPQVVDRQGNAVGPATPPADVDAVRGLFISSRFPLSAWTNATGWAFWSGTSFAAPIAAAIAARVWARHGDWLPGTLIAALRQPPGTVTASSAELGTPVIAVR